MSGHAHIASVVVRARPDRAAELAARIATQEHSEVHAVADGKIIVVHEAPTERALADWMDDLRNTPDVLFVNLVFHQEDLQADNA